METKRIYATVAIVALVGLLFSCVAGAVAGGLAGLFVGRNQGRVVAERTLGGSLGVVPRVEQVPAPRQDKQPLPFGNSGQAPSNVTGALIVEVVSGTPAEQAGLETGDVIVAIDAIPVNATHLLPDVIAQYQPGDQVTVRFWRGDHQGSVTVDLGNNPNNPGQAYLGIYFEMQ